MAFMTELLGLAMGLLGVAGAAPLPERPLDLRTEQSGPNVHVRVVGRRALACDATYELQVSNRSGAGTSRSVQRGTARLKPGPLATFATATLTNGPSADWTARLSVRGCGAAYDVEAGRGPR